MDNLFIFLLNQSLYATYLVVLLLLLRPVLKKIPAKFSYFLWIFVFVRLALPISLELPFPSHPLNVEPIPQNIALEQDPAIESGIESIDLWVNSSLPMPKETDSVNPLQIMFFLFQWIWGIGVASLIAYTLYIKISFQKKLDSAVFLKENIYLCESCSTAFVSGIFAKIYLPPNLSDEQQCCLITHERIHIARLDFLIKPAAWFLLCFHWFNPFIWIAFFLLEEAMELSCDQKAIEILGEQNKKIYSSTLLEMSIEKHSISTFVSFGETSTKDRIKSVLYHKKPKKSVLIFGILILFFVGFFTFTKDPSPIQTDNLYRYKTAYVGDNSKVGGILNRLFFPEHYKRKGFHILSSKEPYALEIFLDCKSKSVFRDAEDRIFTSDFPYLQNAAALFSLIDNLDEIKMVFTYQENSKILHYKRIEVDKVVSRYLPGMDSCKTAGKSRENFSLLCEEMRIPTDEEDWTSHSIHHQKTADRILDKYLPDTIGEDFAYVDYHTTAQFEDGFSQEFFIKTIPDIESEQSLSYAAFHFDRGRLTSYYLKPYGYDFEKGRYFRTQTKNNLSSIDNTSFNIGSEESPSYVNVTLDHPLIYFGTKSSSDGQNTFLQESKPLTLKESEELANEFIQEFIDENITLSYVGENDKGYGQNFEDEFHRYRVIVASDLGYVFRFHDMRSLQ